MYKEIVTRKIFIPVKLSYIIIGGGFTANQWDISLTSVEAFTGDFGKKHFPELPEDFMCCSLFMHNGTISSLGTWLLVFGVGRFRSVEVDFWRPTLRSTFDRPTKTT